MKETVFSVFSLTELYIVNTGEAANPRDQQRKPQVDVYFRHFLKGVFELRFCHTSSSEAYDCNVLHIDNAGGELIIADSVVDRCGSIQVDPSMQPHGNSIRLDEGRLVLNNGIHYRAYRSIYVHGGELEINGGYFFNPIVILNAEVRFVMRAGVIDPHTLQ